MSSIFVLPFAFLWIAILSAFLKRRYFTVSLPLAIVSLILSLYTGVIDFVALAPLGLLISTVSFCGFFSRSDKRYARFLFWTCTVIVVVFSYGLGVHFFNGFNNPLIVDSVKLSPDSIPFTLYWRYDKAFVAFSLVLYFRTIQNKVTFNQKRFTLGLLVILVTPLITLVVALVAGIVHWDPKFPAFFLYWTLSNLFITSTAEEGFFRGIIQYQTSNGLRTLLNHSGIASVTVAALLFGIAHIAMGGTFVVVAIIAGFGYGAVFHLTGRLEASIIAHFIVNTTHLLVFSYPMIDALQ
jgi:membrane protease YdiL (CAAX protease family)